MKVARTPTFGLHHGSLLIPPLAREYLSNIEVAEICRLYTLAEVVFVLRTQKQL